MPIFSSALATAERINLNTGFAADFCTNCKVSKALLNPELNGLFVGTWERSVPWRELPLRQPCDLLYSCRPISTNVAAKGACRGKFSELVPHHILRDVNRHMPTTIMNSNRMAYHLWEDRAGSAPSSNDVLLAALIHLLDFL
jgi:hypothetical protein